MSVVSRLLSLCGRPLLTAVVATTALHAQSAQPSSLLSPHPIGGFASLDGTVTRLSGETAVLSGAEIAITLGHQLSIGIAGYGLVNQHVPIRLGGQPVADTLRFGYGGIRVGYRVAPERPLHAGIELLVGGGEVSSRVEGSAADEDEVFVAVPSVLGEANITSSVRAVGAVSYRFVSGVDWPGVGPSALRGVEARIGLRLGRF